MSNIPTLSALAAALYAALPPGEMAEYVMEVDAWHIINTRGPLPHPPANAPFYGQGFADALQALKMGHTARILYHLDRLAAQVRRTGIDGVLQPIKRVERPIGNIPQPTSRKDGDTARMPRTGKE